MPDQQLIPHFHLPLLGPPVLVGVLLLSLSLPLLLLPGLLVSPTLGHGDDEDDDWFA